MTATTPDPTDVSVWDAWAAGAGPEPGGTSSLPPAEAATAPSEPGWPAPPPHRSPRWAQWALGGLLVATGTLYLWGLERNGWANAFYSAAAQAGSVSWKAWFFGSFDAASSITVDKPAASLWLTGLSVRLFSLSSWSILVPQALLGVASVAILSATVRRWFGAPAGLVAGAVLALTPVATLMFRFNNPDAMLVMLLVCAAWAMGRATERGSWRWIALAGAFVGLAFLAKSLQALLVLPGFVAMYAVAAPVSWRRRTGHLLAAVAAMILAGGWWVATVELWPADSRPFVGGSQTNSVVELILGYNGVGRLTGDETGSVGADGQVGRWGEAGWARLFASSYGGQGAWLIPAAVALLGVLLWVSRRSPRTDLTRAAAFGWGGWLVVTAGVISFSRGIIHEYYTVALAPAVGALVGVGSAALWAYRGQLWARVAAAAVIGASAWWAYVLLARSAQFVPWLRWLVLLGGIGAAAGVLLAPVVRQPGRTRIALAAAGTGLLALLAGPAAYSVETVASRNIGSLPSATPSVSGGRGGLGGGPGVGGTPGVGPGPQLPSTTRGQGGSNLLVPPGSSSGTLPGLQGNGGRSREGTQAGPGGAAGGGGLLNASTPGEALTAALLADAASFTWVAATVGAQSAAGYQLATQQPMMAIGGFNGSDPSPTLEAFQQDVDDGRIHYFIASGRAGGFASQQGGSLPAAQITAWVQETFTAQTIDGVTVYDLTTPAAGTGATGSDRAAG